MCIGVEHDIDGRAGEEARGQGTAILSEPMRIIEMNLVRVKHTDWPAPRGAAKLP
jgi:hypothetical protein